MTVLDLQQLNRATLARQGLLERAAVDVPTMLRRVGGVQAQLPAPPLIGLWSRIEGFDAAQLRAAVAERRVVRGTTLRGTLHLHDIDDFRAIRMTLQPLLDKLMYGMRSRMREADIEPALEVGRELYVTGPHTVAELKKTLSSQFPDSDPQALANVVRCGLQLLIRPDANAPAGWKANSPFELAREQVGDTLKAADDELLVRRFFEVLGPGTPKDVQVWSGLRRTRPIVERMVAAGTLVELATWEGDEIFDLPDAPRPRSDKAAPPRFLPTWDNLLLSHADRSRVINPDWRPYIASLNGMPPTTFLVDGFVHGTWKVERSRSAATLLLSPFAAIPTRHLDALVREGELLLAFLEPDATTHDVRVA